ncbi:MAG TPA: hypothetical protein VMH50_10280 [Thermoleophilia bacterium]|nr:hypothetical protein [Thermoleophilia bacterium]
MDLSAGVAAALAAAGEAFGPAPAAAPRPRWGALYAELDADADAAYATDIELIYEGYLLHYRESRALALASEDLESRLLAGDCFYARGLRGIAARGDAEAVGLLARLMASCSYLRSTGAPFAADDALWAYTTAGLVALHGGAEPASVGVLFDDVEAGFHAPPSGVSAAARDAADIPAAVRAAADRLDLDDPAPLRRELDAVAGR